MRERQSDCGYFTQKPQYTFVKHIHKSHKHALSTRITQIIE